MPAVAYPAKMRSTGRALIALVRLGRPQFLVGGFILYGIGAAVAMVEGARFDVVAFALGQAAVTSIQLMTHYANDYFDLAADQANTTPTRWSGGSRVLPSGILSPRVALTAARALGATGLVLTAFIATRGRMNGGAMAAAAALLTAEILAWFYSAPPVALHSRGLGELTTALVVTGLTPLAAFMLQMRDVPRIIASLGALGAVLYPLVGLQFAMLLAIEFPDAIGDAAVGKRTLVVRLGSSTAAGLCAAILVAVYGALPLLAMLGAPPMVVWGAALPAPIAFWQFRRLGGGAGRRPAQWEGLALRGVALLVGTAACELAALVWMAANVRR
jgi:1,4-dihydroxy-2-naphthoate octaprenyltransferase